MSNFFNNAIDKLQAKPEHVRKRILFGTTFIITGVTLVVWVATLSARLSTPAPQSSSPSPFSLLKNSFQNIFQSNTNQQIPQSSVPEVGSSVSANDASSTATEEPEDQSGGNFNSNDTTSEQSQNIPNQ